MAGETDHSVKGLLREHGDLSSGPQPPHEKLESIHTYQPQCWGQGREGMRGSVASQSVSSKFGEHIHFSKHKEEINRGKLMTTSSLHMSPPHMAPWAHTKHITTGKGTHHTCHHGQGHTPHTAPWARAHTTQVHVSIPQTHREKNNKSRKFRKTRIKCPPYPTPLLIFC